MNRIFNRELMMEQPARKVRQWIDSIIEAPDSLAWLVLTLVAANTLAYIVMFSDPLIRSDAWYFLDVFIRKALNGTLHLGDFFVQRGGMDHAQPLRKLILLLDLKYFDLDFRYEAIAGWIGAIASILVLRRLVLWHETPGCYFRGVRVWIWAALCIVLFSLNSTTVWGWPLVTGGFTSYALLFATLLGLWRWLALWRPTLLIICAIGLDIAADDTAMLVNIACLLTLGILAWQDPPSRKRVLAGAGMLITSLIIVRIGYALLFTPPAGFQMAFGIRLSHLLSSFIDGGWWQWFIVPLASSVAHIHPISFFAGHHARGLQVAIGLSLLFAHAWFWWRVFWKRPIITAPGFAAIVVMLIFYAFLAGIIYGRVSIFGNAYLNQPRYVLPYSFNIVALLLMCAACSLDSPHAPKAMRPVFVAIVALFAFWQIPISIRAWDTGPYVKIYQRKMAWQIGELARHPKIVPEHCAPELVVCNYPAEKRIELMDLLKSHRINVFSLRLQRANQLSPDHPPK